MVPDGAGRQPGRSPATRVPARDSCPPPRAPTRVHAHCIRVPARGIRPLPRAGPGLSPAAYVCRPEFSPAIARASPDPSPATRAHHESFQLGTDSPPCSWPCRHRRGMDNRQEIRSRLEARVPPRSTLAEEGYAAAVAGDTPSSSPIAPLGMGRKSWKRMSAMNTKATTVHRPNSPSTMRL